MNAQASAPAPVEERRRRRFPLPAQIGVAVVVGVALGLWSKDAGVRMEFLGELFVHLIEMVIIPLLFPMIVLAISTLDSVRALGRLAGKSLLYFEIVTTLLLFIGLAVANLTDVGAGISVGSAASGAVSGLEQGIDFEKLLLDSVPSNIFAAFSSGNILAVIVFGVFFGIAMAAVGERAKPIRDVLQAVTDVMFKVVGYVIRFTPIGVFGFIAYNIGRYGLGTLLPLGQFVLVLYLVFAFTMVVVFPLVAWVTGVRYVPLLRAIADLVLIAFVTRSTEAVLAPLLQRLERHGVGRNVTSFTVPLGYSFNADGSTLYEAVAVLFIANAYGIDLGLGEQLAVVGVLMVLTKGIAGVPSAPMVVLLAAAKTVGLPAEGVAMLLAVDFFVDMPRTAVQLTGNALAGVVIGRSERSFTGAVRRNLWERIRGVRAEPELT